ncbi:hypothetical protein L615_003500000450 [Nocardioides sp. J9]|uniref:hypothetical protein n=1 Tax=unclassified Nocardioides TaxID=2615069 RepID=UPI000685E6E1|nr:MULTISPECIES: hypothetical protein [unclassified Nocardioides]TWG97427.1 hypothetical protein L615_003500000450 [Nocardioides sp. J9]
MPHPVITTAADLAGRALSAATSGIAALRPAEKPLHPEGRTWAGLISRTGSPEPVGVPWIDTAGEDEVLVRTSRAIGLPGPVPDILGLAVRLPLGNDRYADLLLANTGWSPVARHLLVPAFRKGQPLTTLLPYRTEAGPVVLGARGTEEHRYELSWAPVGGAWRHLGVLTLQLPLPDDAEASFDPIVNTMPGLEQYPWVEQLRERSYATARRLRGERTAR